MKHRNRKIVAMLFIFVFTMLFFVSQPPTRVQADDLPTGTTTQVIVSTNFQNEIEQEILNVVNEKREENGMPPISYAPWGQQNVDKRTASLNILFAHQSLTNQESIWAKNENGYVCGENIALTHVDKFDSPREIAEKIVEQYMNSPRHRQNILSKDNDYLATSTLLKPVEYQGQIFLYAFNTQQFWGTRMDHNKEYDKSMLEQMDTSYYDNERENVKNVIINTDHRYPNYFIDENNLFYFPLDETGQPIFEGNVRVYQENIVVNKTSDGTKYVSSKDDDKLLGIIDDDTFIDVSELSDEQKNIYKEEIGGTIEEPTEPTTEPTEPTEPSTEPTEPSTEPTEPTEPSTVEPTEPTVKPTEPSTEPTEPSTVEPTEPTEPTVEPTEPSTVEPTEPSTDPTEPSTVEPTEPSVEPTEPSTVEPTEPSTEPTEPSTVEPTEPSTVEPTEPSTDPTEPSTVEPTEPSVEPTEPSTVEPTEPSTVEPTEPSTEPTEPSTEPTEPTVEPTEPSTVEPTEPTVEPTEPSTVEPTEPSTVEPTEPSIEPTVEPTEPTAVIPEPATHSNQPDVISAIFGKTFIGSAREFKTIVIRKEKEEKPRYSPMYLHSLFGFEGDKGGELLDSKNGGFAIYQKEDFDKTPELFISVENIDLSSLNLANYYVYRVNFKDCYGNIQNPNRSIAVSIPKVYNNFYYLRKKADGWVLTPAISTYHTNGRTIFYVNSDNYLLVGTNDTPNQVLNYLEYKK